MRFLRYLLLSLVLLTACVVGGASWWLDQPLPLAADTVELSVEPGTSPRGVAEGWRQAGVQAPSWALYHWFRWSGESKKIRAGSYEIERGVTPRGLLQKMVRGDQTMATLRLIEGWTFRQVRAELGNAPGLQSTISGLSDEQVMAALGMPDRPAEGQFFPDTYAYNKGAKDLTVLRRAQRAMQQRVADAWATRSPDLPLGSESDLLILASIVEKETGAESDRGHVAAVFLNRLRIGMRLQTDPTVIYGLGAAFDGNLRKRDLQTDTPFNTYTRAGLPPTPIAMPSKAALMASVRPAPTKALYFVARGDGTSVFSETLADHNRAVDKYQRGR